VLAIEFDRSLIPALQEVVGGMGNVRILHADASSIEWNELLQEERWTMCANLPYNIAVPIVERTLGEAGFLRRWVVMLQQEVAGRLVAVPGEEGYGPVSLRVAYHAEASIIRRVPPEVFWPRPAVGSAIVRLDRRGRPAVDIDPRRLFRVVAAGFAVRRKTIRAALRPLVTEPDAVLTAAGVDPRARAEQLGLAEFARIAEALPA
jgi:16S rRNA (adenine1518-N6/adenine1519-N6)-dimethyltransferase